MLYTKNSSNNKFEIVYFQIYYILFLIDKILIIKQKKQLYKANLLAKKRRKLYIKTIKFNTDYIKHKFYVIHLISKR